MTIIGVIPARYGSSRFPGKPLADICGKPMIWWTFQRATQCKELDRVYVATDDARIRDACQLLKIPVMMTSPHHRQGTDRVAEVAGRVDAEIFVNIQGDEPLIEPDTVATVLRPFREGPACQVASVMSPIQDPVEAVNTTVSKVVTNAGGLALYISRSIIPFPKEGFGYPVRKALGLYAYSREALHSYSQFDQGITERVEGIELLRFIENGIPVQFVETKSSSISVDTEKDLARVTALLSR